MKIKNITTKNLKNILAESYTRGASGKDYHEHREEMQKELWDRQNKQAEKEIENLIKQYNRGE